MINALARLQHMQSERLPPSLQAMGISVGLGKMFSSHPPLEERIAALQAN
jgi:heat shock protein HtpX